MGGKGRIKVHHGVWLGNGKHGMTTYRVGKAKEDTSLEALYGYTELKQTCYFVFFYTGLNTGPCEC